METLGYLLDEGSLLESRNGQMRECLSHQFIIDPAYSWLHNQRRAASPAYAGAETLWYFSGSQDTEMLQVYAPQYKNFAQDNGLAYGAYGPRIMSKVGDVIHILRHHLHSRQAVLNIWDDDDIIEVRTESCKDIPCTLTWQFFVRFDMLHMIVTMRSNDVWLGTPYDVFAFTTFQHVIASELGLDCGVYTHQAGSMHLYAKHFGPATEVVESDIVRAHEWPTSCRLSHIGDAIDIEKEMRKQGRLTSEMANDLRGLPPIARDLVLCCNVHFEELKNVPCIHSPALRCGAITYVNHRRNRLGREDNVVQEDSGK